MNTNIPPQYPNYQLPSMQNEEEDESGFDIIEWLFKILRHWYLFAIALTISLSAAFLANRTWKPAYEVTARVILGGGQMANGVQQQMMQGVNLNGAYKNNDNQMIMFTSNDLIEKAVNQINANVDYYTTGHFKVTNLYGYAPVEIRANHIADGVYEQEFNFKDLDGTTYEISHSQDKPFGAFSFKGRYGELLNTPYFSVIVNKTDNFEPQKAIFFAFLSNEHLVDYFSSRISLSFVTQNSTVLAVSLVGNVYSRDIDFLNALCDEFILDNLTRKNEEATRTVDFIDKQLNNISDSLHYSEGQLQHFRKKNQLLDLGAYGSTVLGHLTLSEEKLIQYNLKANYLDYLNNYIKKNINSEQILTPSSLGIVDPVLTGVLTQYNEVQRKLLQTTPQNPYYSKYQEDLSKIKTTLIEALKNVRSAFEIEKNDIQKQANQASGRLASIPDLESQMNRFERQFKMNDTYYTFLLQKRAEAQIQRASNVPDNSILERARMVSVTNEGDKKKSMMLALILGLGIPMIIIVLKELLKTKLVDKKEIEKLTSYTVLGTLPHNEENSQLAIFKRPKSSVAEAYRTIRTRAKFAAMKNDPTHLVVTSTESGEGKTHFCMNYASICALTGESTILVDLDLRRPSVKSRLGLNENKGVTNVLTGEVTLDQVILKSSANINFDVLLAGTIPPNPGELIRSAQMLNLIAELKNRYHYVIIDTSPMGIVSDAYPLINNSDCTLYIARSKKTHKKFFKTVLQQFKADKIQHVGIVLNDMEIGPGSGYAMRHYGQGNYGYTRASKGYIKDYYEE